MSSSACPAVRPPCATLLAASLLALAASCSKPAPQAAFQMPPTPVETAVATRQAVADRFTAVGTVEAAEEVVITFEVDGRVSALPFTEGDAVSRGDVLARLDDAWARAEQQRAEALLERARVAQGRAVALVRDRVVPQNELDDRTAELRVAEADLALARVRLDKTLVRAPFAGRVGQRHVSPGAYVHAGDAITVLTQADEVKIAFSVPERYLSSLREGAVVTASTTAWPDDPLQGRISLVDPVVAKGTRSASAVARVPNLEGRLRPGMSAEVAVVLAERGDAVTIPAEAVFVEGDLTYVYVVGKGGAVARTALSLGTRLADVVEVTEGLQAGARVVRAGHQKLYDGAMVAPTGEDAPAAGAP